MTDDQTPRDHVVAVVSSVLGAPAADVRSVPTLFDLPGFDSLAVVAVLDRLETALRIEVPPELIVPEAFESLDSVVRLLDRTLAPTSAPGGQT